MAIRADQVGSSGAFGAVPVFWGTALISGIAMFVAVPIGLMSAIYLSEYANRKFRAAAKPPHGDFGGYSNRGIRLFCRSDGGALYSGGGDGPWHGTCPPKAPLLPGLSWVS